jgi:beta-1,4-mannooligosaccharide/beta-1,4-mannosyl-N-acetylglucosamine phosphorylase
MSFSIDTRHGIRSGLAVTDDFKAFELLYLSVPDNRNVVLFPERQGGRIMRFERPFPVYGRTEPERFDIWFAQSPDGRFWGEHQFVLGVEHVPWANCKIGPGTPPIRTEQGWLSLFHAVDTQPDVVYPSWRDRWTKRYTAGVMLTDLDEPWRVIGRSPQPVLVPETDYELDGYRGSVVFPCSMVPEDDGTVKVYYGAADTVTGLATGRIDDLLAACEPIDVPPLHPPNPASARPTSSA